MEQVSVLRLNERALLNRDRIVQLKRQLGEPTAQDVLCRAVEEIAARLEYVSVRFGLQELPEMRKSTRSLLAIADQVGLDTLTMVADDVLDCIDNGDLVALSATHDRLLRVGQNSLTEIWDMQDIRV
ncbi:hypothetical protein SAMN05444000_11024 [Shimia gijangensis]|uniref:Uncharacterized protein n=1 Tax=Shimia gijangensis TaxID=1470563 RepID=A0A1M6K836_9RHOB|nr:hypothetical protein [Shimia gijangensis]SHJ55017.1 hypothetical protein SAMN05444000_11024 [Shimia gijangensis]